MSKFPKPLTPGEETKAARKQRYDEIFFGATSGALVRCFIAGFELFFAVNYGSASLFMDALSTGLDIAASGVLILSFKLAAKPPDRNHPFGHGRFEPLAGLQLGLFLAILGGWLFVYNTNEIAKFDLVSRFQSWLFLVPFFSMILLEICYQRLKRIAKRQMSPALYSEAMHYRVDSLTSLFAMIALLLSNFAPSFSQQFDHLGASFIALFMVVVGINAAKKNIHQLLDRVPSEEYFSRVRKAALATEGVLGTEKIRMLLYGPDAHVDIDIEVDPLMTVEVAHEISQRVRVEIQKEVPETRDVIVHIEPYYPGDH